MSDQRPLPDLDRLSTLAALILLAFALARIIILPSLQIEMAIFNILIPLTINTRGVMLVLAAMLSVTGADWLAQSHPRAPSGRRAVERWILPGLTALGIGSLLTRLSGGWQLWLGLMITTLFLLTVFLAEFLTIDPHDPRRVPAAYGLEILAYVLVFGTAFGFHLVGLRVVFLFPAALLASSAVAWRLFRLRHPEVRSLLQAGLVGWGFTQLAVALHYWPFTPIRGSLFLVLFFYLGVNAVGLLIRNRLASPRLIELGVIGGIGITAIIFLT